MKIISFLIFFCFYIQNVAFSNEHSFNDWLSEFKNRALEEGVSISTITLVMNDVKFLPKVIEYDRYQPEFYEDTLKYIGKRVTKSKIENGINIYQTKKNIIDKIEKDFNVEKELLLALMGIETNYGKYLGKMDIVSSLSTLSYDKRRSEFFTKELIILLKLIDKKIIEPSILYGSWAGAFGNFQFMPRTIKDYALDYDSSSVIDLKGIDDSFASAANYINKIGWKTNQPCFYKINLKKNIPTKYLNKSAKKIKNKKKFSFIKNFINNSEMLNINENTYVAIITPDSDIIPDSEVLSPAYLIFENYEKILKWNRSLRFALAVCTLKNRIKNEL